MVWKNKIGIELHKKSHLGGLFCSGFWSFDVIRYFLELKKHRDWENYFLKFWSSVHDYTHSCPPGYITCITHTFCRIEFVYWSDSMPSFSCQVDSRILKKKNSGSTIYNVYCISKKKCECKCVGNNKYPNKSCTIFIDYCSLLLVV